jgi:hypothetical protein
MYLHRNAFDLIKARCTSDASAFPATSAGLLPEHVALKIAGKMPWQSM